jgi:hypothetical protein
MATYDRSKIVVRTVRYTIPAAHPYGAHPDEITKALTAAHTEFEAAATIGPLRFVPRDDEIAIEFDIESTDS